MEAWITIWLNLTIPAIILTLILGRIKRLRRWQNLFVSGLVSGMMFSGALMWEDAAEGFCCREYHATVWTELVMYVPMAIVFAGVAWLTLAVIQLAIDRLRP